MILYKGHLYDNSKQEELIDSLKGDLYAPIFAGRQLMPETVINACDKLVAKVMNGEFDDIVKPFLELYNIDGDQFNEMLAIYTKEKLTYKCSIELCDDESSIDDKVIRKRYPLGVLLHIAAGNVDVLPAYSVAEGLLSGNVNILKLPMGDSGLSVRLLMELIKIEPELQDYIYVFDVPSTETVTLKKLADLSDGVVVWGGDMAVKAARTLAGTDTKIIAWGHKLSFAYAEPDVSDEKLITLAKAICTTNQLLCSSCQGIFIDTDSKEEQKRFAERFFEILKKVNAESSPVSYGMKAKNAIRIYNEKLESHYTGNEILDDKCISVTISDDTKLELSYLYRNVWIKRLPEDSIYELKQYKGYLQTAAVLTDDKAKFAEVAKRLADVGVVRLTTAGNMSRTVSGEAHDGVYALREYSRIVEIEKY